MAEGAWVHAYDSLWDSQKTHRLAKELKVTTEIAAAKYLKLLRWARENADNGQLGGADRRLIAKAVDLPERRGDEFYLALQASRFISSDLQGRILGWEDGPGKLVSTRESDRLRKEHGRQKHIRPVDACPICRRSSTGQPLGTSTNPPSPSNSSVGRPPDGSNPSGVEQTRGDQRRGEPPNPRATAPDRTDEALAVVALAQGTWQLVLEQLAKEITAANFVTWFKHTRLEVRGTQRYVIGPNAFAIDWLRTRYLSLIAGTIATIEGLDALQVQQLEVRVVDEATMSELDAAQQSDADQARASA